MSSMPPPFSEVSVLTLLQEERKLNKRLWYTNVRVTFPRPVCKISASPLLYLPQLRLRIRDWQPVTSLINRQQGYLLCPIRTDSCIELLIQLQGPLTAARRCMHVLLLTVKAELAAPVFLVETLWAWHKLLVAFLALITCTAGMHVPSPIDPTSHQLCTLYEAT